MSAIWEPSSSTAWGRPRGDNRKPAPFRVIGGFYREWRRVIGVATRSSASSFPRASASQEKLAWLWDSVYASSVRPVQRLRAASWLARSSATPPIPIPRQAMTTSLTMTNLDPDAPPAAWSLTELLPLVTATVGQRDPLLEQNAGLQLQLHGGELSGQRLIGGLASSGSALLGAVVVPLLVGMLGGDA
jgi:hypothetical protein